jgi:hypothetical protein
MTPGKTLGIRHRAARGVAAHCAGAAATATCLVSGEQLRREVQRQEQAEECNQAAKYEFHQVFSLGRKPHVHCTASLCA